MPSAHLSIPTPFRTFTDTATRPVAAMPDFHYRRLQLGAPKNFMSTSEDEPDHSPQAAFATRSSPLRTVPFLGPVPAHPSVRCAVRCSSGDPPLGPQVAEKRGTGRQSRRKILVGSSGTHSVRSHRVAPSWRSGYLCVSFVDCSLQSPDVHGLQVYRDTLYSP